MTEEITQDPTLGSWSCRPEVCSGLLLGRVGRALPRGAGSPAAGAVVQLNPLSVSTVLLKLVLGAVR